MTTRPRARPIARLLAAALFMAVGAAAAAPAAAEPALWVVKDADSTLYLFGTVHVLRPQTVWRSPRLDKALADSQELWLEIADPDDVQAMRPLIVQYGLSPDAALSGQLSDDEKAKLAAASTTLGVSPAALERLRPWLAALTLSVAPLVKAGFDPQAGVDRALKAAAVARGEPVRGLETAEEQVRYLADLPPTVGLDLLRQTLDDYQKAAFELDAVCKAWADGDVDTVAKLMDEDILKTSPPLYKALIVDRNAAFAQAIANRMAGSGVSFVAIGAAHLAGPDSVQVDLERLGFKVERL